MDERLFYKCVQWQVHFTDKKDPSVCGHSVAVLLQYSAASLSEDVTRWQLAVKNLWYITDVTFVLAAVKGRRIGGRHGGAGGLALEPHQWSILIIFIHDYPVIHNPLLFLFNCILCCFVPSLISSPPLLSLVQLQRKRENSDQHVRPGRSRWFKKKKNYGAQESSVAPKL